MKCAARARAASGGFPAVRANVGAKEFENILKCSICECLPFFSRNFWLSMTCFQIVDVDLTSWCSVSQSDGLPALVSQLGRSSGASAAADSD